MTKKSKVQRPKSFSKSKVQSPTSKVRLPILSEVSTLIIFGHGHTEHRHWTLDLGLRK